MWLELYIVIHIQGSIGFPETPKAEPHHTFEGELKIIIKKNKTRNLTTSTLPASLLLGSGLAFGRPVDDGLRRLNQPRPPSSSCLILNKQHDGGLGLLSGILICMIVLKPPTRVNISGVLPAPAPAPAESVLP